jgi:anti-sigma factor RsiW
MMETPAADLHALLPWHLNGTLDDEESRAFRAHLATCPACAREAEVLGALRAAVRRHGEAFFEPHPAAADIVAHAEERLDEPAAGAIRRHLEFCATCSVEDRIVRRGGLPATGVPSRSRRPAWRTAAAAALAASILTAAGVLMIARPERGAPATGPVAAFYVAPPERDGGATEVRVPRGAPAFQIVLPVEAAGGAPLAVVIEDRTGRRVFAATDVTWVYRGTFLLVLCARADFPDGDYLARVTPGAGPGGPAPPQEFLFRVRAE